MDERSPAPRPRRRGFPVSTSAVAASLLTTLLVLVTLAHTAVAAPECGCTRTGPYEAPARKAPVEQELSPGGGEFQLTTIEQTAIDVKLHVVRVATGATVVDLPLPLPRLDWGFSPDGKRLMYRHALIDRKGASVKFDVVGLYDLATPKSVYHSQVDAGAATAFSPQGKWFQLSQLTGPNQSELLVKDAETGQTAFSDSLVVTVPPGSPGDQFGTIGTGFSNDAGDRSFVRAYRDVNGQDQLVVRNLDTGTNVVSTTVPPGSWWQFSPCGDVVGLVTQPDQVNQAVSLHRTVDGTLVGPSTWLAIADHLRLESTLDDHRVVDTDNNGTATIIAVGANTADSTCTPAVALDQVVLSPTTVDGGDADSTGTVGLTAPATSSLAVTLTH